MRVGVAWFRQAEWDRLRASAADPGVLERSYAEWLAVFERSMRTLRDAGVMAEKVEVRVAELEAWCLEEKRPLDSAARSEFAALLLHRKYHPPTGTE
jgi:hypothetical protein